MNARSMRRKIGEAAKLLLVPALVLASAVAWSPALPRASAWAVPVRDDEDEERDLIRELGRRSFVANCLICHAEEMTTRQRLPAGTWRTEVEKMIGWGAPVPPDEVDDLLAYLTGEYPPDRPLEPAARVQPGTLIGDPGRPSPLPGADARAGANLYAAHCATCHGEAARGADLGPNLVERPILVDEASYRAVVRDGLRRMPGYRIVLTPAQEADILAWLRQHRAEEPAPRGSTTRRAAGPTPDLD